jgi:hypothetical protein
MDAKIQTSINLFPFGNIKYTLKGNPVLSPEQAREKPVYQSPRTTDIDSLEFDLVNDITIAIPDGASNPPH